MTLRGMALTERTNAQWISDLKSQGIVQETALDDLRSIVLSGLPYALSKWISPTDPQFDSLSEEVTQDALLRVLDKLDTFEGRSKFTTWVYKIAVRVALTELRRKRWQDVSLETLLEGDDRHVGMGLLTDSDLGPELAAEQSDMIGKMKRIILEELTDKQQSALIAIGLKGMPMEEVSQRMQMNRNALYKLMHDARLRLKQRMISEGLSPEDVLRSFQSK
jgi:RNA polymerase sigma-70 factor (ECF subfamily)